MTLRIPLYFFFIALLVLSHGCHLFTDLDQLEYHGESVDNADAGGDALDADENTDADAYDNTDADADDSTDADADADDNTDADAYEETDADADANDDADADAYDNTDADDDADTQEPAEEFDLFITGTYRQIIDNDDEVAAELTFDIVCEEADCDIIECVLNHDDVAEVVLNDCSSPIVQEVTEEGVWTLSITAESGGATQIAQTTLEVSLPPFTTVWVTNEPSDLSGSNQIELPLLENGNYHFRVDWGDGEIDIITAWDQSETRHTYSDQGEYTVHINGIIDGWGFGLTGDSQKLHQIQNWGPLRLTEYGYGYFRNASNLTITAQDVLDLSQTTTLVQAFSGCTNLSQIPSINDWDTSNITSLRLMFWGASAFNQDLSDWDTSNVTDMTQMFEFASAFNGDISGWDTSNITNMSSMFRSASAFNQDLSNWDTSSVTNMYQLFNYASAFNGDISDWDTSNVTDMRQMFTGASAFNQDLSEWEISTFSDMSYMFSGASAFNGDISGWNTSSVTDMSNMFRQAAAFNGDISDWDTSNVTNMSSMFNGASSFNQDIGDWDTSSVTNMSHMFDSATAFDQPLSGWNTSNVTNMSVMFGNAKSFNRDIGGWVTRNVTRMNSMFFGASNFNQDIGGWDTSSVTRMDYLFYNASSFNQDIGDWDISAVTAQFEFFLVGANLSVQNYDKLLIGWAQKAGGDGCPNYTSGMHFNGGNSKYSSGAAHARNTILTDDCGWTISDGGPEDP